MFCCLGRRRDACPRIDPIRDPVVVSDGTQLADCAFVQELKTWLRLRSPPAIEIDDRLFSASSGNSNHPACLELCAFDLVFKVGAESGKRLGKTPCSPSIAVFFV